MKIGFIGVGKMASAIIQGLKETSHELIISGSSLERSKEIAEQLGLAYAESHQALIDQTDFIILGIKPQMFESVLQDLQFHQPLMSIAAGISLARLEELVGQNLPLFRIMPNMNAQILKSTTGLCYNGLVDHALLLSVKEMTDSFGKTFEIAEKDFDTFTALAGSSPAYIYLFIEAMAMAGLKNGLPKDKALEIISQTVQASAQQLLAGQEKPNDLIDKICSPGGTTITGLMELEAQGLSHAISSAIDKTIEKAKQL
ncbi:pyrroline-5-carboxylate reductase [Streptococcus didelphis]|uniref:Pyrroline-5-carboxylate reductase n=1 Tax=Streptococcus didelphis TaxID=102886 RepID=A0ABY9LIZ0_9STRE|nr:pyrroline-5-carboxylate reductase [Streptococcus didelphis]WMB28765.1 pyrroline-5-carboxylate reductase [Streptococcus didelphis]WMB29429.1 pyrroline-5-carboxylate reductase [Streptococcus didelphis]